MFGFRWRWLVLPALLFVFSTGCALPGKAAGARSVPPDPRQKAAPGGDRALLLNTGAIQLGPGLGKNAYRWRGDGQWGF